MNTKIFFFNENTKKSIIFEHLKQHSEIVKNYVATITKLSSGNRIGYFQFFIDKTYYKFYIMPKIYKVENGECGDCESYKQNFIEFFRHYYRLVAKYNINNFITEFGGNISDLSVKSNNSKNDFSYTNITNIDDFIVHNYSKSLNALESFFIKHKKQILIEQEFKSQSIKSKLNIKKNLLNFDKSIVYQTKKIPMIYSEIALITIVVLKEFSNKKLKIFSNIDKTLLLKKEVNQLSNLLKKRFPKMKQEFNIKDLLSRNISKMFEKNNSYRIVYRALLKLASKEHYYDGDAYEELLKEEETISLFFQPEKLYEWIVYDKLIESEEFDEVLKEGKDDVKKYYYLEPFLDIKHPSLPDMVVKKDNNIYPIDAKWKILSKKDSKFDNDIFKLRRDAMIRNVNKGFLIYPKKENSKFKVSTEYNYSFDKDFKFELKIINV